MLECLNEQNLTEVISALSFLRPFHREIATAPAPTDSARAYQSMVLLEHGYQVVNSFREVNGHLHHRREIAQN